MKFKPRGSVLPFALAGKSDSSEGGPSAAGGDLDLGGAGDGGDGAPADRVLLDPT